MAFPTLIEAFTTNGTTASTTQTFSIPDNGGTGTVAGDLYICIHRSAAASATNGTIYPAGWNKLTDNSTDTANDRTSIAWYKATGAEGGSPSVTVTVDTSAKYTTIWWSIRNAAAPAVTPPQLSTIATGNSTAPNATTCTPTGGAKDYLWITVFGITGETAVPGSAPSGYSNLRTANSGTAGAITTNCVVAGASRTNNATNEDAAAWSVATGDLWQAFTIAVHPAGGLTSVDGNASGTGTATGVSGARAVVAGAAAGVGTPTGAGAARALTTASVTGTTTPAATGAIVRAGVGASAGTSTVTGAPVTVGFGGGRQARAVTVPVLTSGTAYAYPINVTAGSLLIVGVGHAENTTPTVTDTLGHTWSSARVHWEAGFGYRTDVVYTRATASGADSITVTTGSLETLVLTEYAGPWKAAPLDQAASAAGSSSTPSSGNLTPTANGAFIFGFIDASDLTAAGTGFNLDVLAATQRCVAESLVQTTAAADAADAVASGSVAFVAIGVSFLAQVATETTGASAGTGTASASSATKLTTAGSAAGVLVATGTSASVVAGAGSAAGAGPASAAGAERVVATAASTGVGTATAPAVSFRTTVAATAGTTTVTTTAAALAGGIGASAGGATVAAIAAPPGAATATSAGTGTAIAAASGIVAVTGAVAGLATVAAPSGAIAGTVATAAGHAITSANSDISGFYPVDAAADGTATVESIAASIAARAPPADGTSVALAAAAVVLAGAGTAAGSATVAGATAGVADSAATATGTVAV